MMSRTLLAALVIVGLLAPLASAQEQRIVHVHVMDENAEACVLTPSLGHEGWTWAAYWLAAAGGSPVLNLRRTDATQASEEANLTQAATTGDRSVPLGSTGTNWTLLVPFTATWGRDEAFPSEPSQVDLHLRAQVFVADKLLATDERTYTLAVGPMNPGATLPEAKTASFDFGRPPMPIGVVDPNVEDVTTRLDFQVEKASRPVPVGSTGDAKVTIDFSAPRGHEHRAASPAALVVPADCSIDAPGTDEPGTMTHCHADGMCTTITRVDQACRDGCREAPHAHHEGSSEPSHCHADTCATPSKAPRGSRPEDGTAARPYSAAAPPSTDPVPAEAWAPWAVTASLGIAGLSVFRSRRA